MDIHVRKEFPTGHRCSAIEFSRLAGVRNGEAGDSINTGVVFKKKKKKKQSIPTIYTKTKSKEKRAYQNPR